MGWRRSFFYVVTEGPISTQGLTGNESMKIAFLPFSAWSRRWHLSLLTDFHMAPSLCKGAGSVVFLVPAEREVWDFGEPWEKLPVTGSLLLHWVGTNLSVFLSIAVA